MSVQFAALMALSRTHTQEQQSAVANQLTERKRKEEEQRKKRLERERKELELEKKRRVQHFENLKREDERQKEKLEKEKALEAERERRAQAQLDVLRYGPKKAVAKYPARENPHPVDDNKSRAEALTREELRERKRLAEQRRMLAPSKRTLHHTGTRKPGKRLPGGAIDTTASLPATASTSAQTTRERIAAIPPTLVKLNQVKRDLRTIDEIQTQLKNAKALEGDQARSFGDYFVDRKKDSVAKPKQSPTPPLSSKAVSKASTPVPKTPKTSATPVTAAVSRIASASSSRSGSHDRMVPKAAKTSRPSRPASVPSVPSKKRRGTTLSPPPSKRRAVSLSEEEDYDDGYSDDGNYTVGSIYKMLRGGRADRTDNIFSDEEDDMEVVDARILEKEEKMSARIAQREEAEAAAAERRHEEEKARRKKERALALARGQK